LKFFALDETKFTVTIEIRNFELRHVLFTGILLNDLKLGSIPVGFGKSKGYGRVKATSKSIKLAYHGLQPPADNRLRGIADHPRPEIREEWIKTYRLTRNGAEECPELPAGAWQAEGPWKHVRTLDVAVFEAAWKKIPMHWEQSRLLSARAAGTEGRA
jgi:hypothetical protein